MHEKPSVDQDTSNNRILVITGVSGSGKDYLLSKAQKDESFPSEVQVVSFGQEIFNLLKEKYPEMISRDDMRHLVSQEDMKQSVVDVTNKLIENQPLILNTHVVVNHQGNLILNPEMDKVLSPLDYIFVWSDPDQIYTWRRNDQSRIRESETVDAISLHQDIASEAVKVIARHIGARHTTLWNRVDNIEENIDVINSKTSGLIFHR